MHIFSSGKIQVFIQVGGYLPFGVGGVEGREGGGGGTPLSNSPSSPTDQPPVEPVNLFSRVWSLCCLLNLLKINLNKLLFCCFYPPCFSFPLLSCYGWIADRCGCTRRWLPELASRRPLRATGCSGRLQPGGLRLLRHQTTFSPQTVVSSCFLWLGVFFFFLLDVACWSESAFRGHGGVGGLRLDHLHLRPRLHHHRALRPPRHGCCRGFSCGRRRSPPMFIHSMLVTANSQRAPASFGTEGVECGI